VAEPPNREAPEITVVTREDLGDLLPLMRGYCDFYEVNPSDEALLAMSQALIADQQREGVQFLARGMDGEPLGFATLFWTWSTAQAARLGVMNDLFVIPAARGLRVGERLIEACRERCREHGAESLAWQTALDNERAQRLYDRVGATKERWLDYSLPT